MRTIKDTISDVEVVVNERATITTGVKENRTVWDETSNTANLVLRGTSVGDFTAEEYRRLSVLCTASAARMEAEAKKAKRAALDAEADREDI